MEEEASTEVDSEEAAEAVTEAASEVAVEAATEAASEVAAVATEAAEAASEGVLVEADPVSVVVPESSLNLTKDSAEFIFLEAKMTLS